MIALPSGIRTEEELFGYFSTVFGMIGDVPVVLQDFPGSTGVWMSVPSILRLIENFSQIKVVKEEDLPSLEKISQLRAGQGRRVSIMTGNNGLYLPYEMARGIDGPMAGFSHPEMLSGVYRLFTEGEIEAAHDLFDRYLPLLNYEGQGFWGVAARKEVMRRRGAIRHATMRRPGPALTAHHLAEIDLLLRRLHRSLGETGSGSSQNAMTFPEAPQRHRSTFCIDQCRSWLGPERWLPYVPQNGGALRCAKLRSREKMTSIEPSCAPCRHLRISVTFDAQGRVAPDRLTRS